MCLSAAPRHVRTNSEMKTDEDNNSINSHTHSACTQYILTVTLTVHTHSHTHSTYTQYTQYIHTVTSQVPGVYFHVYCKPLFSIS